QADRDHAAQASEDTGELDELITDLDTEIRRSGLRGKADPGRPRPRRQRSTRRRQDTPDLPNPKLTPPPPPNTPPPPPPHTSPRVSAGLGDAGDGGRPAPTRALMTISGPPGMRCISPPYSIGSFKTCVGSSVTTCSTSPPSSRRSGWRRTCTSPSAGPSPGPS